MYSDSESSSRADEDSTENSSDESSCESSSNEVRQPYFSWDGNKRASVTNWGYTIFWVDGSCKGNHLGPKDGATSGVGVWVHGKRRWKKFNHVYPHTNNYAELYAMEFAVDKICYAIRTQNNRWGLRFQIRSDSKYAVNCMTKFFKKWRRNGWKTKDGRCVKHKKPIQKILAKIKEYNLDVQFIWIPREANCNANDLAASAC